MAYCSGIAFIQGDSAGGSKLIEQTISFDSDNFEVSKIYQGNLQLFFDTSAVTLRKKSKLVGENFFPALKMQFGRFY